MTIRWDEVCGRHSGFPPCCVRFYVDEWIDGGIWLTVKGQAKYNNKKVGYVPCPKCLKNKTFVEVKPCPDPRECMRRFMMGDANYDFVPPWKPIPLLQELYFPDRWAMMVCCIFLNCTRRKQVDAVVEPFFRFVWGPEEYIRCYENEEGRKAIIELIRPLGFYNRRAERIYKLSKAVLEQGWDSYKKLPGVGQYAARCYEMLFLGQLGDTPPNDHALKDYWEWYKETQ